MSERYKAFIRKFQMETIGQGISVKELAEMMCVHPKTVYGWFRKSSCMDGDSVIRAINIMGGYQC